MKLDDKHELQIFVYDIKAGTYHKDHKLFRKANPEAAYDHVLRLINIETDETPAGCRTYYDISYEGYMDAMYDYRTIVAPRTITFNNPNNGAITTVNTACLSRIHKETTEVAVDQQHIESDYYIVFKCKNLADCFELATLIEIEETLDLTHTPCRWATKREIDSDITPWFII